MLVAFTLENYKSFRERETLSFVATTGDEHPEHTITLENGLRVNRFAAIIGGNGAGKSQLIAAINDFARAINNDNISKLHQPFLFSKEKREQSSKYEVIILDATKNNFLRYGLSVLNEEVFEEYLYTRPVKKGARETCVFLREKSGIVFKKIEYKKQETLIRPVIKNTGAIVTFGRSLEIEELESIRYWAVRQLPYNPESLKKVGLGFIEQCFLELLDVDESKKRVLSKKVSYLLKTYNDFIIKAPLHIDGVDFLQYGDDGKYRFVYKIKNLDDGYTIIGPEERHTFFSQGTLNVLAFLAMLIWANDNGFTLYVDEIDSSIHYSLANALIKKILKRNSEIDGMQFVLSTHNIPLLDECFRRDELNIIIKDSERASSIVNASSFSVRKDAKISAKYLRGEFGALPTFLGLDSEI